MGYKDTGNVENNDQANMLRLTCTQSMTQSTTRLMRSKSSSSSKSNPKRHVRKNVVRSGGNNTPLLTRH